MAPSGPLLAQPQWPDKPYGRHTPGDDVGSSAFRMRPRSPPPLVLDLRTAPLSRRPSRALVLPLYLPHRNPSLSVFCLPMALPLRYLQHSCGDWHGLGGGPLKLCWHRNRGMLPFQDQSSAPLLTSRTLSTLWRSKVERGLKERRAAWQAPTMTGKRLTCSPERRFIAS